MMYNDVVNHLETTLLRDQKLLMEMRVGFRELVHHVEQHHDKVKALKVDSRLGGEVANDPAFVEFAEVKLKVAFEYLHRMTLLMGVFRDTFPNLLYLLKQVRIQLTMARSQLKHHFDMMHHEDLLNAFGDNIKSIIEIIKNLSLKVGELQNNYAVARELDNTIANIIVEIDGRLLQLQRGRAFKEEKEKKKNTAPQLPPDEGFSEQPSNKSKYDYIPNY